MARWGDQMKDLPLIYGFPPGIGIVYGGFKPPSIMGGDDVPDGRC